MIYSTRGLKLLIAFLLAVAVLFIVLEMEDATVSGATITVDDDGPADFDNIGDAVDAANDGDTIMVAAGHYHERVGISKRLSLIGSGSDSTFIDGGRNGYVMKIASSAHGTTIRGFNITRSGTSQSDAGIEILSDSNVIEDVILYRNENGIICSQNAHNTIGSAIFVENDIGLNLDETSDNHIHNSTFINQDRYDIEISSSQNILLRNNELGYQGIMLYSDEEFGGYEPWWNTHTIDTSNTIDGRPIIYVKNQTSGVVSGIAGQVIIANCENIVVRNLEMIGGGGGLIVGYSSYINITKNTISDNGNGITLYRVDNCTVSHNTCENNGDEGIYYGKTDNLTIFNNEFRFNDIGIRSGGNQIHVNITGNNCSYNIRNGLLIGGSGETFTVTRNYFYGNGYAGIYVVSAKNLIITLNICIGNQYGLFMRASDDNNVTQNQFMSNEYGIYGELSSENNIFQRNNCSYNTNAGIFLLSFDSTIIRNNTILGNVDGITLYSGSEDTVAEYNYIIGNTGFGINATDISSGLTIDARMNWWGTGTGPYHATDNPSGEGDEVTDDVVFDPWLDDGHELKAQAYIMGVSPNPADDEIDVRFEGIGDNKEINKYAWRSSIDGEFYNGIQSSFESDQLSIGFHVLHFKVRQKDGNIWSEEVSTTLLIHDRPMPTIEKITPANALDTDDILFGGSGTDDGTIVQYAWRSSRDGEFYNGTEAEFTYRDLSNGTHTIYLKVMDNFGSWSDEVPGNLKIQGRPVAHIDDISPNPALLGENVTIEGRAEDDGSITRIIWKSSISGTLDDDLNETIWRDDLPVGEHTISMVVVDDKNVWSYEVSQLLVITLKPEAFIDSIVPDPALDTDSIHFKGHGTDGDGTITLYEWRSDIDGILYSNADPEFDDADLSNGTHTIFLRVQDNYGVWSDEVNKVISVYGKPRARIVSIFPNPALINEDVYFRGTGSDDGFIERYAWRSSIDGEFYNDTDFEFYFSNLSLGTQTIFYKVMDNDGIWSDEVSRTLVITSVPAATIESINPSPAFDTETITFNGSGADDGTIVQYAWRSDIDGEFYNDTAHTFGYLGLTNGTHAIFFRVKDNLGFWSDEANTNLIIYGKPRAHIDSIKPRPASPFDTIIFTGYGTDDGNIIRYSWRSSIQGVLYNDTESTFNATAFQRGHHTIFLKVQDDDGFWSDEVSILLIISDIPVATIDSISPSPALHTDTIYLEGHGMDNGNIELYAWRSDIDGEFYNGTQETIVPFNLFEGFEGANLTYNSGGYTNWFNTNATDADGLQSARSGEVDDDEFSWMETTFPWPGTLEFDWKVSSEDEDYLKLYIDGKLKSRISGNVDWSHYSITFDEGGHTVRWSYEKDLSVSFGDDIGYVDSVRFTTGLQLSNGTHMIYFKVLDNEGFWSKEVSSSLTVDGKPIILNAVITPSPAYHNDLITFNASVLDDGNITRYLWRSTRSGVLYDGNSSEITLTNLVNGTHLINFTVLDETGIWSDLINFTLDVRGKPFAIIVSVTPNPALATDILNFIGNGTDDGSIITYSWRSSIDGEFYNGDQKQINVTTLSNGSHTIFFKVRDNRGYWSDEVSITLDINGIPTAIINSVTPSLALDTEDVTFNGIAVDDGDVDRYVWRSSIDGTIYDGDQSIIKLDTLSLGFHLIYLKVQDDKGIWSAEVSGNLTITEKPVAVIDFISPNPATHIEIVAFRGHGTDDGTIEWYEWRSSLSGQLYSGNLTGFNSTTLRNGTHVIDFRVLDNYNFWSDWVTLPVLVNGIPRATIISFDPAQPTNRDTVNFYGSEYDDGNIQAYSWRSNRDGILSDEKSFSISSLTNGTHSIYFKVMDNNDLWSEEASTVITINGYPEAIIEDIVPGIVNEGVTVWFYGKTNDDISLVEFQWESDLMGLLNTKETFSNSTLANGTHQITFRARDSNGLWSDYARSVVTVNGIPRAHIGSITPVLSNKGDSIEFSSWGSDDNGLIKDYSWRSNLVPGILSIEQNFTRSDLPNGTHTIFLRVKDQENVWSEEVTMTIEVNGFPVASIDDITPNPGVESRLVTFFGSGFDDGGSIKEYAWRSSIDGPLNSLSSFGRTDLSVGVHTIFLQVKDSHGIWSPEISSTLLVNHLPKVSIMDIIPAASNSGDEVTFYGRGEVENGTIVSFLWKSSLNGELSTEGEFTNTGLFNGTHAITLRVLDANGIWSDAKSMTITVNGLPGAKIVNITERSIKQGDSIGFTAAGTDGGSIIRYQWTSSISGELYNGPDPNFNMDLNDKGTHTISLRVLDDMGAWSEPVSTLIWVNGIPGAQIDHISKNPAEEGDRIFFRAKGTDDGSVVQYLWKSSRDGIIYEGPESEFRIDTLSQGNHTISLTVQDDEGVWSNPDVAIVFINEKDEDGTPWVMYIAGGGIVIALGILFGVVLPRRNTGGVPPHQSYQQGGTQQSIPGQPPQTTQPSIPGQQPPGKQQAGPGPGTVPGTVPVSRPGFPAGMGQPGPGQPMQPQSTSQGPAPHPGVPHQAPGTQPAPSPPGQMPGTTRPGVATQTQIPPTSIPPSPPIPPTSPPPSAAPATTKAGPATGAHPGSEASVGAAAGAATAAAGTETHWFCPKCGNKLENKFIFCTKCGYKR